MKSMDKLNTPRSRLGRGLSSLLASTSSIGRDTTERETVFATVPTAQDVSQALQIDRDVNRRSETADTASQPFRLISLSDIQANPHQPRRLFSSESVTGLAASIKANGVIQPVIVRATDKGYELIAGERRLRAATEAGLSEIPAIVREADSFAQAQMAIVENIQREDLNPIDRAIAYQTLLQRLDLTQADLAARLGESRTTIANHARLLELPETVQEKVRQGQLTFGHAKVLAGMTDTSRQTALADMSVEQGWSVRTLEAAILAPPADTDTLINASSDKPADMSDKVGLLEETPKPVPSAHLKEVEATLTRTLGLRVQLRKTGKSKGRLVIHYASLDQFDELMKRLDIELQAD
jgi:ParB family transcriptional regulator, chromosome partitioning protein